MTPEEIKHHLEVEKILREEFEREIDRIISRRGEQIETEEERHTIYVVGPYMRRK